MSDAAPYLIAFVSGLIIGAGVILAIMRGGDPDDE